MKKKENKVRRTVSFSKSVDEILVANNKETGVSISTQVDRGLKKVLKIQE